MFIKITQNVKLLSRLLGSGGGGGGQGLSTYGTLTNAQILAIGSPSENETADSSDDLIRYTYILGAWRSTAGGTLA